MDSIDITSPDTYTAGFPHQLFQRLRAEAPVAWHLERQGRGFWSVVRHHDCALVLRSPAIYSSWRGGVLLADPPPAFLDKLRENMLNRDPPEHTALRGLVAQTFHPRRIVDLEGRVARQAAALVDAVRAKGRCDFVTEIAGRMPLFVICELLGVPHPDREALYALTARMFASELEDPAEALRDGMAAAIEIRAYGAALGRDKRVSPRDDLASELLAAEIDGRKLSDGEFEAFFMLLFNAGSDTTRSLLGFALDLLLDRPELVAWLRADPTRIPAAIEEILRFESPVIQFRRTATRDTELAGSRIAEGDKVVVFFPSANRDDRVFRDPNTLDLARAPNPHLGFGHGIHYCVGAPLARLEGRCVLGEVLAKLHRLERLGPAVMARSSFVRSFRHLEIAFD